jgi:lysophospholipase L1-like esterase
MVCLASALMASAMPGVVETDRPPAAIFQTGDRWTAMGDSITESGQYPTWVEYFFRCRSGGKTLSARNAGVGGDTTTGARQRMGEELRKTNPTLVTFFFGMNDVNRGVFLPDADPAVLERETLSCRKRFEENLGELVRSAQAQGARVAIFAPPPFEHSPAQPTPDFPGVNGVLRQLSDRAAIVAEQYKVPFVDVHRGVEEWTEKLRKSLPEGSLVAPDRVHPGPLGQLVIGVVLAENFLKDFPGQEVVIDARDGRVFAENVKITLPRREDRLAFDLQLSSLPVVLPKDLPAPFLDKLRSRVSGDLLRIRHLPPGRHSFLADGIPCGSFSEAEWEKGVNLSTLADFPPTKASRQLYDLLVRKMHLQWEYRQIAWCEFFASQKEPGVSGTPDVIRVLRLLQNERPYLRNSIELRLKNYERLKAGEEELLQKIADLEMAIDEQKFPLAIHCEIVPEDN